MLPIMTISKRCCAETATNKQEISEMLPIMTISKRCCAETATNKQKIISLYKRCYWISEMLSILTL